MARIGYVLNAFPVVSETFILNELRAVEAAGLPIAIFSLSQPPDGPRHRALGELRCPRVYPPDHLRATLAAHARRAASRPGPYLRALRRALCKPGVIRSRKRLRKTLRQFHHGVWISDAASRLEVVHLHAHYAKEPLETADHVRRLTGTPYSFAAHAKDLFTTPGRRLAERLHTARFAVTCHRAG